MKYWVKTVCIILLVGVFTSVWAVSLPKEPPLPQPPKQVAPTVLQASSQQPTLDAQVWVLKSSRQYSPQQAKVWVDTLKKAGYPAYMVLVAKDKLEIIIGPSISQKAVLQQQKTLSKQHKFSTTVNSFQPLERGEQ